MSGKRSKPAQTPRPGEDKLDDALKATFPASDPVAVEPIDGPLPAPSKEAPARHDKH